MARKITRKNFYMEIRRNFGRFISILFIVALGVAFFSGIRASEPSMRITGDAYFDESDLMDIKAVSTLGITKEDVSAVGNVKGVGKAEGAYSADFLNIKNKKQYVLHVMSAMEDMNKITVREGRMPEKAGECLVDDQMNYKIGETIKLKSGTDDKVTDTLKTDELKVVGKGNSPYYISLSRGSTTIGTGTISGFVVVPEKTFDLDVYTEMYVQVAGAKDLTAYTKAYKEKVKTVQKRIEAITEERGKIRKSELEDKANEKLAKAQKKLDDGKAESKQKLEDAKKQITDGETQVSQAKEKIASGKSQIAAAKQTIDTKQKELDQAKKTYQNGLKELSQGKKQYEQGKAAYDSQYAEAQAKIQAGEEGLVTYRAELDKGWAGYQTLLNTIEALKAQAAGGSGQNPDQENPNQDQENPNQDQELLQKIQVMELQAQETKKTLDAKEQDYQTQKAGLDAAKQKLASGKAELDQAKAKLDASEAKLTSAAASIESGQKQLDAGKAELKAQEQTLQNGETEIAQNEAKLADARKEYEDGKETSEEEIAKGEKKLADAKEQIKKIKNPKWYVYNRSTLVEYDGFGENANRMRAIGKVFPVMFFLVAALISLTGMTRMVEEQRIEIGTMKALGYGNFSIASKYLGYAFLATAGGSILGVLTGEKILPYIIIYAYEIMYPHIPKIYVPYHMSYAVMASAASIVCTMGATLASCYKELAAEPAVLMRPPAPKEGRRILLERMPFLWKHLNFTWKSSLRNLFRYKKRMFMTVFGIAGSMALMLVGYGIRDSISDIVKLQYTDLQRYDAMIISDDDATDAEKKELQSSLEQNEDLDHYTNIQLTKLTAPNGKSNLSVYVYVPEDLEKFKKDVTLQNRVTKQSYELPEEGAAVSEKTATLLHLKAGDELILKKDDKEYKVKISVITENYAGHYVYMSPQVYEENFGEKPDYSDIVFTVKDKYKDQLEEIGQKIMESPAVLSISYTSSTVEMVDRMLSTLGSVIVVLIVSAGMLAFVVLYNLNNINITERQRELATLKVLGFFDMEVSQYVLRENILLTIAGILAGSGFGILLHRYIIVTIEVDAVMFGRNIRPVSFLYCAVITCIFSVIVNIFMHNKLKKIDMVESLKSVE